jgi:hypothetical protein
MRTGGHVWYRGDKLYGERPKVRGLVVASTPAAHFCVCKFGSINIILAGTMSSCVVCSVLQADSCGAGPGAAGHAGCTVSIADAAARP